MLNHIFSHTKEQHFQQFNQQKLACSAAICDCAAIRERKSETMSHVLSKVATCTSCCTARQWTTVAKTGILYFSDIGSGTRRRGSSLQLCLRQTGHVRVDRNCAKNRSYTMPSSAGSTVSIPFTWSDSSPAELSVFLYETQTHKHFIYNNYLSNYILTYAQHWQC